MRAHGYLKPVVVGEHAGPQPFEFGEAMAVMQETFAAAFAEAAGSSPAQSTDELTARACQDTPERRVMTALYDRMESLPPRLQMFMAGCPAELEARRQRINCRQVVMRTLLALSEGVRRTAYWNLAPEYPGPVDHLQMMHLMIGKLPLLGYRDGELAVRHPAAETFALLAQKMAGARSRVPGHGGRSARPYAFEVDRAGRGPLLVIWDHRDPFDGEDEPPAEVSWPWPAASATVTDVFGRTRTASCRGGRLRCRLGRTRSSCRPDEYPGRRESQLRERIYVRATRSDQQEGDQPEVRGPPCIRCSCSCTWKRTPTRTSRTSAAARPGPAAFARARPCGSPPPPPIATADRDGEFRHVR